MTYQVGGVIQAADINSWLNTVNSVWGVGSGDRGYGQTSQLTSVASGNTVTSAQWGALRNMIAASAAHQGDGAAALTPASLIEPSDVIYAHVNGTAPNNYNFGTLVSQIDTNRHVAGASDMSLTLGAYSNTRATAWSGSIQVTVDVDFGSENNARYFFNTGGQIRLRFTPTGLFSSSGQPQDADWRDIFANKVGTMGLAARSAFRTGSSGTMLNSGFYGLSTTETLLYNGTNIGGGAYAANDVLVYASVRSVVGANGGNGTTIRFRILLQDDHVNGNWDSVAGGVNLTMDTYKVNTNSLPVAISAPSYNTPSNW